LHSKAQIHISDACQHEPTAAAVQIPFEWPNKHAPLICRPASPSPAQHLAPCQPLPHLPVAQSARQQPPAADGPLQPAPHRIRRARAPGSHLQCQRSVIASSFVFFLNQQVASQPDHCDC